MSADTNYNAAVERGDARFLILTLDQAEYIRHLVRDNIDDWKDAAEECDDVMIALGESVLEQLEKR